MDGAVLLHILCDQCRNVFSGEDASPSTYKEDNGRIWAQSHHCFSALKGSALAGCHLCSLIASQIQSERDGRGQGSYLQKLDEAFAEDPRLWIEVDCGIRDSSLQWVSGEINVMLSQPKIGSPRQRIATLLPEPVQGEISGGPRCHHAQVELRSSQIPCLERHLLYTLPQTQ